jgi:hypothetical protein
MDAATAPGLSYVHTWRNGDVVMWDNRATMHRGRPWPAHEARRMVRTTIWSTTTPIHAARSRQRHEPNRFVTRVTRILLLRTRRGITMVGLFSASITRAEWEAAAPYREAMAAKRLARMARG